jgi:hypothetical protein
VQFITSALNRVSRHDHQQIDDDAPEPPSFVACDDTAKLAGSSSSGPVCRAALLVQWAESAVTDRALRGRGG